MLIKIAAPHPTLRLRKKRRKRKIREITKIKRKIRKIRKMGRRVVAEKEKEKEMIKRALVMVMMLMILMMVIALLQVIGKLGQGVRAGALDAVAPAPGESEQLNI
tara:strand:- start:306 stop:620 length:315 start_codon:yes stop_codon:yes gene_type:complete